jgi:hypothetical protein
MVVVVSVVVVVVVVVSVDDAAAGGASASISNKACSIASSIRSGFAPVPTRGRGRFNTSHCQIAAAVSRSAVVRLLLDDDDNNDALVVIDGGGSGGDDDVEDDNDDGVYSDDDCGDAGLLVVAITSSRWIGRPRRQHGVAVVVPANTTHTVASRAVWRFFLLSSPWFLFLC